MFDFDSFIFWLAVCTDAHLFNFQKKLFQKCIIPHLKIINCQIIKMKLDAFMYLDMDPYYGRLLKKEGFIDYSYSKDYFSILKVDFEYETKSYGFVKNYERKFWLLSDDHRGTATK